MTATTPAPAPAAGGLRGRLVGGSDIDFIGRSRLWAIVALVAVVASLAALGVRGLNFGIDFVGGTSFVVEGARADLESAEVRDALAELGVTEATVQIAEGADGTGALVTTPSLGAVGGAEQAAAAAALADVTGVSSDAIDVTAVGPRWGAQISRQALEALAVFLALVVVYIALRFEWRMAVAALVTLVHDVLLTVGVYALVGFEVSPASVIALLTILGYSLYDTVVVFDRVKETTAALTGVSNYSYGEVANGALNQVLVRSLSTSLTSLLPVGSLLFIGATLLGADTLSDLALALFIGMGIGTYSSIVVATPALVWLKEREPRFAEMAERAERRRTASTSGSARKN